MAEAQESMTTQDAASTGDAGRAGDAQPAAASGRLAALRGLLAARRFRLILAGVLAATIVGAGLTVWLHLRSASLESVVDKLNTALAERNLEGFERVVDVMALARDMGLAVADVAGETDEAAIADLQLRARRAILNLFADGTGQGTGHGSGDDAPAGDEDRLSSSLNDPVFDILKTTTHLVPADLLAQLAENPFGLKAGDGDVAVLSTSVEHLRLGLTLPVLWSMSQTSEGWRVTGWANAAGLATSVAERVARLERDAVQAFTAENERILSLMQTYYHVEACRAVLFPPGSTDVVRLRLVLSGKNLGDKEVVTSASICDLLDENGQTLGSLRLENTRSVPAGEAFEHSWFFNFEQRFPQVEALLAAQAVTCTTRPVTVSLGRGNMLYQRNLGQWPGVRLAE